MTRDPGYYWLRVAMYTMVGLCLGTIFWKVGFKYSSILVIENTFLHYLRILQLKLNGADH